MACSLLGQQLCKLKSGRIVDHVDHSELGAVTVNHIKEINVGLITGIFGCRQ